MHMDVKLENVVYDGMSARLIDWGMAASMTDYVTEDEGVGRNERPFPIVCPLPPGSVMLPSRFQQQLQQLTIPHIVLPATGLHFERHVYGDVLATYMVACKEYADMQWTGNQGGLIAEWLHLMAPLLPTAYKARLLSMGERVKVVGTAIEHDGVREALMGMDSLLAGVYFCQLREIIELFVELLPNNRLVVHRGGYIRDIFVPNADLHGLITSLYVLLMDTMQFVSGGGVESKVRRVAALLMYKYLYSGMFATLVIEATEVVSDLGALTRVTMGETVALPVLDLRPSNAEQLVAQGGASVSDTEAAAKQMMRVISASVVFFE
jgi:hypothetical protein